MSEEEFSEENEQVAPNIIKASESPVNSRLSPLAQLAQKRIDAAQLLEANPEDVPITPLNGGTPAPLAEDATLTVNEAKLRLLQATKRKKSLQAAQRQASRGCRSCGSHRRR